MARKGKITYEMTKKSVQSVRITLDANDILNLLRKNGFKVPKLGASVDFGGGTELVEVTWQA